MSRSVPSTVAVPAVAPLTTAERLNDRIREESIRSIRRWASTPQSINRRLAQLDQEWDVERTLDANAAAAVLAGVALGTSLDRRWLALPALAAGFLLQQAAQGWCPAVPLLRRMGVRTRREIQRERSALKALRGDFRGAGLGHAGELADPAADALGAAEL
jgi:hypothetical protein